MDVQRAIRAPFLDAKWFGKSLWAMLWTGLGVTAPAVTGYALDYIRNVAQDYETPLPEWNREFGRWWVRGFLVIVAGCLYALPAIILLSIGVLPLVGTIALSGGTSAATGAALASGIGTVCLTTLLATLWLLAVSIFFWAAEVNYAFSNQFGALFRFSEIMARLRTPGAGFFAAWGWAIVLSLVSGIVSGIIGGILGGIFGQSGSSAAQLIGGFLAGWVGFIATLMTSHLFGQYAARAYGFAGATPAPTGYATPYPSVPVPGMPVPPAPVATTPPATTAPMPPAPPVAETEDQSATPGFSTPAAPDAPTPPGPSADPEPPSGSKADPPAEDGRA